jgi:uncharacterized protein YukE
MAGFIKVDKAGVQGIATSLTTGAEDFLAKAAALGAKAAPGEMFVGQAGAAYENAYQRWQKAHKEVVEAVRALGKAVSTVGDNFSEVDSAGARGLDGFL